MECQIPSVDDHYQIQILVRQFGSKSNATFNRLLEKLYRIRTLQVSENPRRFVVANFTSTVNSGMVKFGELQAFRKVLGLIGVIQETQTEEQATTSENVPQEDCLSNNDYPESSAKQSKVITSSCIKRQYEACKAEFSSTLVDSRCIIIGFTNDSSMKDQWSSREILSFDSLDDFSNSLSSLENGIREFLRSLYFVLESRRLDISFEKKENLQCPLLSDEQKYRVTENKNGKIYKKKCIGRLRKQVGDCTLMTGLPSLAIDAYQSSIDCLRSANDLLWLAAAYEGWACAAITWKYDLMEESCISNRIQRTITATPQQMRSLQNIESDLTTNNSGQFLTLGEQNLLATNSYQEESRRRFMKLPLGRLPSSSDKKSSINNAEVVEKIKLALEHYERYSFAACVEYECMMRGACAYRYHRNYIEMEAFIREHIAKYLDDDYTIFDSIAKANICLNASNIYRMVGFRRKCAFFSRLAMIFRLHVHDLEARTVLDYRHVYPILYRSLIGYNIPKIPKESGTKLEMLGPVLLQKKVLHEVFMSALRSEYHDAAIRHLCFLLQVYHEHLDIVGIQRLLDELFRLVSLKTEMHQLNQHISLPQCSVIIPSLQMTNFPLLEDFVVSPLPPHLAPNVIRIQKSSDIFIYSPFQCNEASPKAVRWVVDCACEVSVKVTNRLPFELSVHNLSLLSEGCSLETVPVRLSLASCKTCSDPVDIKLIGVPREAGKLNITGYSCEVLGVRNICRLKDMPEHIKSKDKKHSSVFDIDVLPALPVLTLRTSLSRAPISENHLEPIAELSVYSGQTFEHTISIVNTHESICIADIHLEIRQPKVCGGPCLIELINEWIDDSAVNSSNERFPKTNARILKPLEEKRIKFRIFGIDPSATTNDETMFERGIATEDKNTEEQSGESAHDRIPFTGRLLTAEFIFRYKADIIGPDSEQYERQCRLPLAVSIVPAVIVSSWHVLPGDGPATRYVVVDVTNSTEWDAELTYGEGKMIGVQSKEICRVPLLCKCCSEIPSNAFQLAANRPSHMMQMQEMEHLRRILERHVASHLDIRWSISNYDLEGTVPVGPLLSSIALLKQLVVPTISFEMSVNGVPYFTEDDIVVGIGEVSEISVRLITSIKDSRSFKGTLQLECYRDLQNGTYIENDGFTITLNTEVMPFSFSRDSTIAENDKKLNFYDVSVENDYAPSCCERNEKEIEEQIFNEVFSANFYILFRYEGYHKIKPLIFLHEDSSMISKEELFCSPVSFNVITKVS